MKKVIFTLIASVVVSSAAFSQVGYGVKAGLNISKFKSDFDGDTETTDNRLSAHFGGFLVTSFSDKLALQPEFVISMEGGKDEYSDAGIDVKETYKYTFINIPVLLRYTVVENFNLYAGPQIGINVGAKLEVEFDGDAEEDDIEDVSPLSIGLGFGAGYYVTENIELGVRYNAGLSNLYNGDESEDFSYRINTIQIGVAYKIK